MGSKTTTTSTTTVDPNVGIAALKSAETGDRALDYMQSQADISNRWAAEDRATYKSVYQPVVDAYAQKAADYDNSASLEKAASEARADVALSAAQQKAQTDRALTARGVNPNSGAYAGIERATDTDTALASAGAQNVARTGVRQTALNMQGAVAGFGQQSAGNALSALSLSNSAASSGFQTNIQGQSTAGQLWGMNRTTTGTEKKSGDMAGTIGSVVGAAAGAMMMFSSKDVKEDKRPVDGALDAVMSLPVEAWRYKEGVADEAEHIGAYAEDFQRATGMGDGKSINVIDAIGLNMKATQELAQEVRGIQDSLAGQAPRRKPSGRGLPQTARGRQPKERARA